MSNEPHLAFDKEALFSKSQAYMARAYRAETDNDADEYQLWASLALELLAKSTLSSFHPALIADPNHYQSLFAACGVTKQLDVKTIAASTLYKRLSHLSKQFDHRVKIFCEQLSLRRNSELHSGESPFVGMKASAWENLFWHTTHTLLSLQNRELADWLQPDKVDSRQQFLHDSKEALQKAVLARIGHSQKDFMERYPVEADRIAAVDKSENILPGSYYKQFSSSIDAFGLVQCPSCKAKAVVGGMYWDEEIIDHDYGDGTEPPIEFVDTIYTSEELLCPTCSLRLDGVREIVAAGVDKEILITGDREIEFEPDYGND